MTLTIVAVKVTLLGVERNCCSRLLLGKSLDPRLALSDSRGSDVGLIKLTPIVSAKDL